jgi:hypothetical protein
MLPLIWYAAGSDIEIEYALMSFGVPRGILFQKEGDAKQEILNGFKRRNAELERLRKEKRLKEESETGIIVRPSPKDVLIGRGRPYQDFAGNRRLGFLIDTNLKRYRECSRFEKTCVTIDLVKTVLAYGGRFIERTDAGWKRIDEGAAREKISSGFRTKFPKDNAASSSSSNFALIIAKSSNPLLGQECTSLENLTAKRLRYTTQHEPALFVR